MNEMVICNYIQKGGDKRRCRDCMHMNPHPRKPWCTPWYCDMARGKIVCVPVNIDLDSDTQDYFDRLGLDNR
jgi:hypothetical protein